MQRVEKGEFRTSRAAESKTWRFKPRIAPRSKLYPQPIRTSLLIFGWGGHFCRATNYGGSHGAGVLYQLDVDGDEKVLYTFDFLTANGFGQPDQGVIRDSDGTLHGLPS